MIELRFSRLWGPMCEFPLALRRLLIVNACKFIRLTRIFAVIK